MHDCEDITSALISTRLREDDIEPFVRQLAERSLFQDAQVDIKQIRLAVGPISLPPTVIIGGQSMVEYKYLCRYSTSRDAVSS